LACKYSGQKLSIHRSLICSYGSKGYGNLVLNKYKPNIGTKVNSVALKIQTNRWLGLNKFRPTRQKVLNLSIWLVNIQAKSFPFTVR
jgi:hypothetical protein